MRRGNHVDHGVNDAHRLLKQSCLLVSQHVRNRLAAEMALEQDVCDYLRLTVVSILRDVDGQVEREQSQCILIVIHAFEAFLEFGAAAQDFQNLLHFHRLLGGLHELLRE